MYWENRIHSSLSFSKLQHSSYINARKCDSVCFIDAIMIMIFSDVTEDFKIFLFLSLTVFLVLPNLFRATGHSAKLLCLLSAHRLQNRTISFIVVRWLTRMKRMLIFYNDLHGSSWPSKQGILPKKSYVLTCKQRIKGESLSNPFQSVYTASYHSLCLSESLIKSCVLQRPKPDYL